MEGVAVSLASCQTLTLIHLDSAVFNISAQIENLDPEIIVFELDIPYLAQILNLLKEKPGILLLGLDLECNRVIVLNSRQHSTQTMHDLCQLVKTEMGREILLSLEEELTKALATSQFAALQPVSSSG